MPRARPETTTAPAAPRPCASPRAKRHAAAEALRAPTIATAGRSSRPSWPLTDQQRRRVFDLGEQRRIEALAEDRCSARRASRPARSRARRRRRRTGCGARPPPRAARSGIAASAAARDAEARKQLAIGDRPDVGRADQPQPGDQVGAQALPFADARLGSAPASRPMLVAVLPDDEQGETEQHGKQHLHRRARRR